VFLIGSFDLDIDLENYWFISKPKIRCYPLDGQEELIIIDA
jgi:hypothetical protein